VIALGTRPLEIGPLPFAGESRRAKLLAHSRGLSSAIIDEPPAQAPLLLACLGPAVTV
jgi:hypothetical protein